MIVIYVCIASLGDDILIVHVTRSTCSNGLPVCAKTERCTEFVGTSPEDVGSHLGPIAAVVLVDLDEGLKVVVLVRLVSAAGQSQTIRR